MTQQAIYLGVNIDHVATLRQARGTRYPDPLQAAWIAEQAGADSITAHLREDRRHIQDTDIERLNAQIHTKLNLEMAATEAMVSIAERTRPWACCLVPERREELTTEGGLEVAGQEKRLRPLIQRLLAAGIEVSLFIDPEHQQIEAAAALSAPVVELHTGAYADAPDHATRNHELDRLRNAAAAGQKYGLKVNAGHGLNTYNVEAICHIPQISELNIGHAIIAQAVFSGLAATVHQLKQQIRHARANHQA
ncbi:MAG: pyridoxine 5'-phosphate synthase [Methylococcales bacterium]|nr:pyridoxine 5'-phosphate synthase [Methylococcales bacterium]